MGADKKKPDEKPRPGEKRPEKPSWAETGRRVIEQHRDALIALRDK